MVSLGTSLLRRPSRPRPLEPAVERQQLGHLRRRPRRADRGARPARRDPRRAFDWRRRGDALRRSPRHRARSEGRPRQRDPTADLRTDANPGGLPVEAFDQIRDGLARDRSQFYEDLSFAFYGANRDGSTVLQGVRDAFWMMSMQAGYKGAYDCVKAFSETDLTEDLKRFDIPTLIIHGDDDQIVPFADSAPLSAKLVPDAELKVYPGAPHGLMVTHRDRFHADIPRSASSSDLCRPPQRRPRRAGGGGGGSHRAPGARPRTDDRPPPGRPGGLASPTATQRAWLR
jgi:pimeloyl-ACP methyl ester carboxylesterase